ncbi:hypothetical protein CHARACLAT_024150, partial [Characodon lateralis]|nr:hypothetical protein [Characodon lateralis]
MVTHTYHCRLPGGDFLQSGVTFLGNHKNNVSTKLIDADITREVHDPQQPYFIYDGKSNRHFMVVKTYMDMDQDSEEEKQQYLGLALHLASEFFLRNPNKDVRLLVACCLADIFRIYAPEAPYTSHDKLK